MDYKRIDAALRDASDTHHLLIETGALNEVGNVLEQAFGRQPAVVVADDNTYAVAGKTVYDRLRSNEWTVEEPIVFPGTPPLYASFENVLALEEKLSTTSAVPIVVGSGTLNDITKLAAHRLGRQYLCVSTAASVDGYTAFGAAITRDGFKQTMPCLAPWAVVADLDILVTAPAQMTSSGYGDLLGKVTAGADWILADALEIEPIEKQAWSLVQASLRDWTGKPQALHAGGRPGDGDGRQAIENLFEGLILSGIAMQISHSSRPASGSEHRFSHLWEMQALAHDHEPVPHGFKVGVGTEAAAALYERVLARDLTKLDIDALCRAWPSREEVRREVEQAHDIPQLAENAVEESLAKYITPDQLRQRLILIQQRWPIIRERLERQLMTAEHIRALLRAAGCPTEPAEIGVSAVQLRESYMLARTIRFRYTVLDLVNEVGILDACVDELFAPGGFWATIAHA